MYSKYAVAGIVFVIACQGSEGPQGEPGAMGNEGVAGQSVVAMALAPGEDSNCPTGGTKLTVGATATYACNGATGADGRSPYGNGSAGDKMVISENWSVNTAPDNPQFHNFEVLAGGTLTVPSGTIIRCTGTFVNHGQIIVVPEAGGGLAVPSYLATPDVFSSQPQAEAGASSRAAVNGDAARRNNQNGYEPANGGGAGRGLAAFQARQLLRPGTKAGGGGGGAIATYGGRGGGSLVVIAEGGITNDGQIHADGEIGSSATSPNGGGGGAGGIIVLASHVSITHTGTITADGGAGGADTAASAAGGGGGGGIIHFLAPSITATGQSTVAAGAAGTTTPVAITAAQYSGGGGGGGCGGQGAYGGSVLVGGATKVAAGIASVGYVLQSVLEPSSLL